MERGFEVKADKKIGSLLPEKVNITKQGVEMPMYGDFSSEMSKGDDGSCYYYRQRGEGKEKRIVFYKNNGIKVCETIMPETLQNEGYIIDSFVKYGDRFFIELLSIEESEGILTSVQIKNGKWGERIQDSFFDRIIIYDNYFYCGIGQTLKVMDLQGKTTEIEIKGKNYVLLQTIVDDKIYYCTFDSVKEQAVVMRCNLDGSNEEKLFIYHSSRGATGFMYPASLRIDGEYIYLLEAWGGSTLTRVPLYGGKIEEIVKTKWYDLSNDSIFYVNKKNYICNVDKELKNVSEGVTKAYIDEEDIPFLYANTHLMIKGYNEKERNMIYTIWESEVENEVVDDIEMNYANEYYWVTEKGKVENIIKGSGFKEDWYKLYDCVKKDMKDD